jgi:hypothetical protein
MVPVDAWERAGLFDQTVLSHLHSAYNPARWLATTMTAAENKTSANVLSKSRVR